MFKKIILTTIAFILLVSAAACGGQAAAATSTATAGAQSTNASTLQSKLGAGILKLSGTDLAVTTDQAKTLLPLWKAVKSLSGANSTSTQEMTALYKQIQGALSADQLTAIEKMSWSPSDVSAIIQQYGTQTGGTQTSGAQVSQALSQAVSQAAQGQSQGSGAAPSGNPPSGGAPAGGASAGGDSAMSAINGTSQQSTSTTTQSSTPQSTDLNVLLANAVITLLQKSSAA